MKQDRDSVLIVCCSIATRARRTLAGLGPPDQSRPSKGVIKSDIKSNLLCFDAHLKMFEALR